MTSSKAFCAFCSILIQTNDPSIYENAKDLAVKILKNIITRNPLQEGYISHELGLWVDAISMDTLPTFCKLLDTAQKITVQHDVIVSNAWQKYHASKTMDTVSFTPILTAGIASIASNPLSFSDSFIKLICKVATKMLIQQVNPVLLASVVKFVMADIETCEEEVGSTIDKIRPLVQYASSIVEEGNKLVEKATSLLTALLGEKNIQSKVAHYLVAESNKSSMLNSIYSDVLDDPSIASLIVRQCTHHSHLDLDHEINRNNINGLYLKLFPIITQRDDGIEIINAILEPEPSIAIMSIMLMSTSSFVANERTQSAIPSRLILSYMDFICSLIKKNFSRGELKPEQMETSLSQFFFASAILPMMPSDRLGSLLRPIVNFCAHVVSTDTQTRPIFHLLQKILQSQSKQYLHDLPSKSVFSLWQKISKSEDPVILSTRISLESAMTELLMNHEDYGLNAAHLISNLECQPIESILDAFFRNGEKNVESRKFLIALITFDASMFVTPIINRLQKEIDDISVLDEIIDTAIIQTNLQKSCQNILPPYAIERTLKRFSTLIQRKVDSFGTTIQAMDSLLSNGQLSSDSIKNILNASPDFLQALRKCRQNGILTPLEMEFLDFMRSIIRTKGLKGEASQNIAIMLFTHLGSSFSKVVKLASSDEEVCRNFLLISIEVLKFISTEGIQLVKPSIVKRMMIASLKLGIQSDGPISTHCLAIVRLLLVVVWDLDTHYKQELFQPHQIFAMAVSHSNFASLAMISNSQTRRELILLMMCCVALDGQRIVPLEFEMCSALFVGCNASLDADDYLLRRFLFLYENNVNNIQAPYCQSSLLWGQAQLSLSHTKSQFQEQYVPGSDHGGRWEPLLEALEVRRIRQTITDFPVWETAYPSQIESVEIWQSIDTSKEHEISDGLGGGDVSNDESETTLHMPINDTYTTVSNNYKEQEGLEKDGDKKDERYSPAFVMPLILGILESFALEASIEEKNDVSIHVKDLDKDVSFNKSDDVEMVDEAQGGHSHACRESFAKVVYRLFQRGAISLSLSCLSSKCLDIRRLALSSLHFFLQAVKLKESYDIAQWRERPQLEMMLNSVQRGLTVSRAKKAKQMESDGISKFSPSILVPMLPTVSALFLARAAIVISKPGDDMYASMNRHFLRIQDYHGAYNDCFSLPSFMILFCSTNSDNNQARKERIWALQLLKDGIVDEYSFKAIVRRHVPALLLSSFDGFCCRRHTIGLNDKTISTFDIECSMIVQILQKSLDVGGLSCFNNFIISIGLLPWIQTMMESHSKTSLIDLTFFRMIQSALESTKRFHESANNHMGLTEYMFLFDPIKLSLNVICTYEMIKLLTNQKATSSSTPSVLLSTVCEILSLIHDIHKIMSDSDQVMFQVSKNGIPIPSAISLLEEVKDYIVLFHKAIGALCYLPLTFDTTTTTTSADTAQPSHDEIKKTNHEAVEFCKTSISYILNSTNTISTKDNNNNNMVTEGAERNDIFLSIMKRIKMLSSITTFKAVFLSSNEMAEMVISCRRQMTRAGLYDIWLETLLVLVPHVTETIKSPPQEAEHNLEMGEELNDDNSSTEKANIVRLIVKNEQEANKRRKYK